jgi:CheY-like chemotaxis protein
VTIVENGEQAVEAALAAQTQGAPFHAILMDMQMPRMNGFEAVATLRAKAYRRPIVALTAGAMKGDRESCLEAGCDEYLSKPIDGRVLVEVLAQFVPHRTASAASTVFRSEQPRRVLIVDDSRDAAVALSRLLEMSGHQACVATSGARAAEAWREFRPEFVLVDLRLPDTDGYSLLKRFRNDGQDGASIVAYTGSTDQGEEERIRQAGFDGYLVKPVDLSELERLLSKAGK